MGCAASSDSHTGHEYNSLGYHGTHYNQNRKANNNTDDHGNTEIKPAPRDPTPPPREPTPPPRDPTPPPREPTPPPREPTPPPREPTPPPREPTPPPREPTPPPREPTPPPKEPTPPPPKDPTPPPPKDPTPPPTAPLDDDQDQERYTPTEPEFGTDYHPVGMGLNEVHIDFRSTPEPYDWQARPDANSDNLYIDNEFPLEVALPNYTSEHEWKRPIEIRNAPCLFSGGTERYDIGQGSVGTCWFLSVVSAIADRPKLLRRVIGRDAYRVGKADYDGVFHCRFWRYGNWDNVYIDDYLPIIYGDRIYGARSATDENEMWVSLLEKAFARLHGSYAAVTGGLAADAYIALTGGVAEQIDFDKMKMSPAELFRRIDIAAKSGALMTCTVPDEFDGQNGLVGGHAYSLTGAARVGDDICLVRVRNPWGKQEWQGPWSDQSSEWNTIPPNSVDQVNKEDGEFYMALQDFLYFFSNVTICNLTPDFDRDGTSDSLNYIACLYGDWFGDSAAGFENKLGNPKYVVTIGEYSVDEHGLVPFVMQIIQKNKHRKTDKMSIRCDLYQVMNDSPNTYVLKELGENTNMYRQELQVTYRFHVQPGRYVIVPSTINAGDEKEFMIRLYTPSPLQDISLIPDSAKLMCGEFKNPEVHSNECALGILQKFDGKWISGTNAGGQVSRRETFATNPQFDIRVTCDECVLSLHLLQPLGDNKFPLGMKLFPASDDDTIPADIDWIYGKYNDAIDDIEGKNGVFIIANEASTAYKLPQGRYMLLIHLDEATQETEFSLIIRSNQHCDITPCHLC